MNPYAGHHRGALEFLESADAQRREDPRGSADDAAAKLRYLAFYLPQFHRIAENDRWWGPGFTEWTNASKSLPAFPGHYQPHLPADELGFYDLGNPDVRELQASLATKYGVDAFVYYHYWFHGRRLLEMPFNEVLSTGRPDLPFCLCWANENWTRVWDGGDQRVLVEQSYSDTDDREHMRWLARAFEDSRYVRVDRKPLFLVYTATRLPDPRRTTDIWREEASRLGIGDLYLCRVESFPRERGDAQALGFDASVEFQPDWSGKGPQLPVELVHDPSRPGLVSDARESAQVFSYPLASEVALTRSSPTYKRYRCVMPGWDNSPRRREPATVFAGSSPSLYERWLKGIATGFTPFSTEENLVFINAWNEWGEGNHLEPDRRWGRAYLEAHLRGTGRGS